MTPQYHNMEQYSPEWWKNRANKLTASHATAVMAGGSGLKTYCYEIIANALYQGEMEQFSNEHTERGIELEPVARTLYELETGSTVTEVGCITLGDHALCSPDGLVGDDGLVEIKCQKPHIHIQALHKGEKGIKSDYRNQIQFQLYVTQRKWCDYVGYCENLGKYSLVIHRIYPDPEAFEKIEAGIKKGVKLLEEIKSSLT